MDEIAFPRIRLIYIKYQYGILYRTIFFYIEKDLLWILMCRRYWDAIEMIFSFLR